MLDHAGADADAGKTTTNASASYSETSFIGFYAVGYQSGSLRYGFALFFHELDLFGSTALFLFFLIPN